VNEILEQIKTFYEGLEARQRIVVLSTVAASLVLAVGVAWWSSAESYAEVYASEDPQQVQMTARAFGESSIPYRISDDGTKLEVPKEHLGAARLEAAASGQPSGLDIVSAIELGKSPQQERWMRIYALQQDLQVTINGLEEVESCRVHLVLPDRVNFFDRETSSSASVTLQLYPGRTLTDRQTRGVAGLMTGAVHGLKIEDIYILDDQGNLLHPTLDGGSADGFVGGTLIDQKRAFESEYEGKILEALIPMFGSPRHIATAVNVDLATHSIERRRDLVDPDSGVPISTDYREEDSRSGRQARGIPGAESNLPEQASEDDGGALTSIVQEQSNMEYSRTQEIEIIPAGGVERLTASVSVNSNAVAALVSASNGTEDMASIEKKIKEAVHGALGFDIQRGDQIEIGIVPFASVEMQPIASFPEGVVGASRTPTAVIVGIAAVLMMLLGLIGTRTVTKRRAAITAQLAETPEASQGGPSMFASPGDELVERMRHLVDNLEKVDSEDLNRLAECHEDPSVQVLRRWLKAS